MDNDWTNSPPTTKTSTQKVIKLPVDTTPSKQVETVNSDVFSRPEFTEQELSSEIKTLDDYVKKLPFRVLLVGQTGVGKTHFCLTATEPIFIIDTEFALPRLAMKFRHKKVLCVNLLDTNKATNELDSVLMLEKLDRWLMTIEEMVKKDEIKTVVFDNVSSLWKICQDWLRYEVTRTGGKINMKGVPNDRRDWCKANSKYESVMYRLNALGINVIYTAQNQPIYSSMGQLTGEFKPSYQKTTPFNVDLELTLTKKLNPDGGVQHIATITKCGYPIDCEGKEFFDTNFEEVKSFIMKQLEKKYGK